MNLYTMDQIEVGKTSADFKVHITTDMLELFEKLSGDANPMHTNAGYAKEKGMKDKVVHGMLTASFYSKLVGMYLPGKLCLLHEIKVNFNKPVYLGDCLWVSGVVAEKKEIFRRIVVDAKIVNQNKEKVSTAKIVVGVLNEQ